jgi:hypothetical protein
MEWQDVAAALNKLPVPKRSRRQAQQLLAPGDVVYQHVVGPVNLYLRFEPGPIGGQQ